MARSTSVARLADRTPTTRKVRNATAIAASARRVKLGKKSEAKLLKYQQAWQIEAWEFFDEIPEIKFITWYLGNAMAKLSIFPAVDNPYDTEDEPIHVLQAESGVPPIVAQRAIDVLMRLKAPIGGQSEILRMLNMNLEVPGECWIVGRGARVDEDGIMQEEEWDVRSIREVAGKDGKWVVLAFPRAQIGNKENWVLDEALGDDIFRVWLRHPAWAMLADSLMRGVLGECRALTSLTQQILAEANSRLHAGLLLMPNEASFGTDESDATIGEDGEEAGEDEFEEVLFDDLASTIEDPSNAASVVPLVGRMPGEMIQYVKRISLARDPDSTLDARIEARVRRIARGLNVPVEVAEGHAQTTFSNAEQIDQDIFDDHLQPRCMLIVDAITQGYLKSKMAEGGVPPEWVDRIFCWFDATRLIRQPDATAASNFGLTEIAISFAAWRKANGYDESDAPDDDEIAMRLDWMGTIRKQQQVLAIDASPRALPPAADAIVASSTPVAEPVTGSRAVIPRLGRQLVDIDIELRTRLLVAADSAMTRVLEKAGNRLRSKLSASARQLVKGVPAYRIATTLGPKIVAASVPSDELIVESWSALEAQFMSWGDVAQRTALGLVPGLSPDRRSQIAVVQGEDLAAAWAWAKGALNGLAHDLMFDPDPLQEPQGEAFGGRVPAGLIRSAVARAGGARALTAGAWVSLSDGGEAPAGGIGNGELIGEALAEGGVAQEGWVWVYGPAFRANTFEPHADLEGVEFVNFDDEILANSDGWPETDFFIPGDHDGCLCDVEPILLEATDLVSGDTAVDTTGGGALPAESTDEGDWTGPESDGEGP